MSPRVLRTTRRLPLEEVTYQPAEGLDGQGRPQYGTGAGFQANVLEYDAGAARDGSQFVVSREGSRIVTPLTLYLPGDALDVPNEGDRIVLYDGRAFIVAERRATSGLRHSRSTPDHYRLRCREE